jgi:hypothetical protein
MHKRRNPLAAAPILRKGGPHTRSRTGERQQVKQQLRKEVANGSNHGQRTARHPLPRLIPTILATPPTGRYVPAGCL